jgi:hypothetical protein
VDRRPIDLTKKISNVHFWPLADIQFDAINVRFRGWHRHRKFRPPCPLMTQSGTSAVAP